MISRRKRICTFLKMQFLAHLLTAFFLHQSTTYINADNPLTVSVFYESYCPDCIQFFQEQLVNTWTEFQNNISVELVPFGNAEQHYDSHWHFDCQHGPQECIGNKLHACAIYQACGQSGTVGCDVTRLTQVFGYIKCVMGQSDQLMATDKCAKSNKLKANDIVKCSVGSGSDQGDELLSGYGNRTLSLNPRHKYVHWVLVNEKHDIEAENHLRKEICRLEPPLCSTQQEPTVVRV